MHTILKQAISNEVLDAINKKIDAASSGESFEIIPPPHSETILADFKDKLFAECDNIKFGENAYTVIRSVTEKGNRASQCWHFDNQRKTILIVLRSVLGEENGDILIRPNLRRHTKSSLIYTLTKLFWTNPISWLILPRKSIRDKFFTRVSLKAGDVMVFDGSTTYHGNLPIASGMRRSILIHSDNLFENSFITKLFHVLNKVYLHKRNGT
ncbi:MAG: hypothetical protein HYT93_01435 [Parcubacteria group bacterium]|nr:hypothetical protein [Parcubacteria group bacterium]